MKSTVSHFSDMKELPTHAAAENVEVRPYLPIDLLPRNSICFSYISYELLQIPFLINNMFGSNLTMGIDKGFPFIASHLLPLIFCEQFGAISALEQIILFFFKKNFKFLHEKSAYQLVFPLLEPIQSVSFNPLRHFSNDLRINATHINLDFRDFLNILNEEIHAFLN